MRTEDGSIVRSDGTVVFMSFERFHRDICEGNCCFLCGVGQSETLFNNEHVVPDWLLRAFNLHDRTIVLPNQSLMKYGQYTVPCCKGCNSWLGANFEEPVREILMRPYHEVVERVYEGALPILVSWLYLLFLKTHLKDTKLRLHRDRRKSNSPMSSLLDLSSLHHVHCVARSRFTGTKIDPSAFPSIAILPAKIGFGNDFDYCDLSHCISMLVQIRDTCLLIALDDSGMSQHASAPFLNLARGSLTVIQQRELLARIGFANLMMTERPSFHTMFDPASEESVILASVPDTVEVGKHLPEDYGELFYGLVEGSLRAMGGPDAERICTEVRSGQITFLVDSDRNFNERSIVRKTSEDVPSG